MTYCWSAAGLRGAAGPLSSVGAHAAAMAALLMLPGVLVCRPPGGLLWALWRLLRCAASSVRLRAVLGCAGLCGLLRCRSAAAWMICMACRRAWARVDVAVRDRFRLSICRQAPRGRSACRGSSIRSGLFSKCIARRGGACRGIPGACAPGG